MAFYSEKININNRIGYCLQNKNPIIPHTKTDLSRLLYIY